MKNFLLIPVASVALGLAALPAHAVTFGGDDFDGSFVSTFGVGTGIRTQAPSCDLIAAGATGPGAPVGCLAPFTIQDQGDLNYKKGQAFTKYVKGTHELLLKKPSLDLTFMARGTWIADAATKTTSIASGDGTSAGPGLQDDAKRELRFKARLLDLWVAKGFQIGGESARLKIGNQVANWGESLFFTGGINGSNPIDFQRLSTPGTQVKETLLAQPAVDLTVSLGRGMSVEAYYQFGWEPSYFSPVGSYWSTSYSLGKGNHGVTDNKASKSGQYGFAFRWQPESTRLNLGAYVVNYHDKLPQLTIDQTDFHTIWDHPDNRKIFGLSMNMPVGDWVVSSELSYRPKDAIALNPMNGCPEQNGKCWVDGKRYQWAVNGVYNLTPDSGGSILKLLNAQGGTLFVEYAATYFPGLKSSYNGIPVASGYAAWGQERDFGYALGTPNFAAVPTGTKLSGAIGLDFSFSYDGTVIPGWLITPEIYYQRALKGRTPNVAQQFMQGTSAMSLILNFMRTSGGWTGSINYSRFMGGTTYDNIVRDRDFVGLSASYTF